MNLSSINNRLSDIRIPYQKAQNLNSRFGKLNENNKIEEFKKYFPGVKVTKETDKWRKTSRLNLSQSELTHGRISSTKIQPKNNIPEEIKRDPERKRLFNAAVEFQGIFINLMLKSMRSTLNKKEDILHGGHGQEIFEDLLYDEYALLMSRNGSFKLAEVIYRQLSPGLPPIDDANNSKTRGKTQE